MSAAHDENGGGNGDARKKRERLAVARAALVFLVAAVLVAWWRSALGEALGGGVDRSWAAARADGGSGDFRGIEKGQNHGRKH